MDFIIPTILVTMAISSLVPILFASDHESWYDEALANHLTWFRNQRTQPRRSWGELSWTNTEENVHFPYTRQIPIWRPKVKLKRQIHCWFSFIQPTEGITSENTSTGKVLFENSTSWICKSARSLKSTTTQLAVGGPKTFWEDQRVWRPKNLAAQRAEGTKVLRRQTTGGTKNI